MRRVSTRAQAAPKKGGRPRKEGERVGLFTIVPLGGVKEGNRQAYRVECSMGDAGAAVDEEAAVGDASSKVLGTKRWTHTVEAYNELREKLGGVRKKPRSSAALTKLVQRLQLECDSVSKARQRRKAWGRRMAAKRTKWMGSLDREVMGETGHVVMTGVLKGLRFGATAHTAVEWLPDKFRRASVVLDRYGLERRGGRNRVWVQRTARNQHLRHVHEDVVGSRGPRQLDVEEAIKRLPPRDQSEMARAVNAIVEEAAKLAGRDIADARAPSVLLSWPGMDEPVWHCDGGESLGVIVPLAFTAAEVPSTEFLVPPAGLRPRETRQINHTGAFRRYYSEWFKLVEEDGARLIDGAERRRHIMRAGDVLFFDTCWPHRAPSPPAKGARMAMFFAFGDDTEGAPMFRRDMVG